MKMNIRIISLLFALVLCAGTVLPLCACDEGGSKTTTLYVYNWGEYISDGSEDSLDSNAAFEEWYYETYGERVEVNYSTFSSNEDMYAKLSSGSVFYDVIVPSDYMIERMIDEDMLLPLDYDNIPLAAENLDPTFYGPDAVYDYYDKGCVYSVPYMYGMVGVIYNTTMVDEDDPNLGSWALLWDEKYAGNILQFNNSRDAFGSAQYYLGVSVNSDDEADWRRALDTLIRLGVKRVLTSGQAPDVFFALDTIREMIQFAGGAIEILPGAGITVKNVRRVAEVTGCTQVHLARHRKADDTSTQHNTDIYFGGALYPPETYYEVSDSAYFASVKAALENR